MKNIRFILTTALLMLMLPGCTTQTVMGTIPEDTASTASPISSVDTSTITITTAEGNAESDSATVIDTMGNTDSDTATVADSGLTSDDFTTTGTDALTDNDTGADTGTVTDNGTDTHTNVANDTGTVADTGTNSDTDSGTASETDTDTDVFVCEKVVCDTPDAPLCVDDNTLRTFAQKGTLVNDAVSGECEYSASDETCVYGCVEGGCLPSPVTCFRYVNINATGAGSGLSWQDAYADVQLAIQSAMDFLAANAGACEVWVAKGVYKPTGEDKLNAFTSGENVHLFGGFNGTETSRDQRDWALNTTTLSGDIGVEGEMSDNMWGIFIAADKSVIDGFTFTSGYAAPADDAVEWCDGGAVEIAPDASPLFTNCTFENNHASRMGGAIFGRGGAAIFKNCTFRDNQSLTYGGGGGAVGIEGGDVTFENCVFENNTAYSNGGAVIVDSGNVTLRNSRLSSNQAGKGGAIYIGEDTSLLTATGTLFAQNSAMTEGGGVYVASENIIHISHSQFIENVASSGGGIWVEKNQAPSSVSNCVFDGNVASANGGGIHAFGAMIQFTSSIFVRNRASTGGGLFVRDGGVALSGCTIVNNNATSSKTAAGCGGGGIRILHDWPQYKGCIIRGNNNTETAADDNICSEEALYPIYLNCDIDGSVSGSTNINADPQFVRVSSPAGADGQYFTCDDGLQLKKTSPCIDAAADADMPERDILGNNRFDFADKTTGNIADMGAYEYIPAD